LKLLPNGEKIHYHRRLNPEIPIPEAISKIHGITNEMVANEPSFNEVAGEIFLFLENCDFAGYNSNYFDIPFLVEELLRVGMEFELDGRRFVDVQAIFHKNEPRDLKAAYRFYCQKELTNAHSAVADINATYEILLSQLDRYPDTIKPDVDFLHRYTAKNNKSVDLAGRIVYNDKNIPVFNFGKHKGRSVAEVFQSEPSYFQWMMDGDFPEYTKRVITKIRLQHFGK
jgi:DNA polymerase-3 subunit epsilon